MTVKELYNSVAQLGFEDSLEYEDAFFFAVNRALLQVNALRPVTSACVIYHQPLENKVCENTFVPVKKKDELCFVATDVRAFYFEANGNGEVFIELFQNGEWVLIGNLDLSSNGDFMHYRGFIKRDGEFVNGDVRLRFIGEYLYSVKNVAMYEYIYSESEEDIPAYGSCIRYDISRLVDDFLALESLTIENGKTFSRLNQGYDVENDRVIILPRESEGVYKVVYQRKPKRVEVPEYVNEDETVIDLDEELCTLLPLLIAYYIWVDDEPEKSEYYLTLYRERVVDFERRIKKTAQIAYNDINGW